VEQVVEVDLHRVEQQVEQEVEVGQMVLYLVQELELEVEEGQMVVQLELMMQEDEEMLQEEAQKL
jgi:hypothetical protein